MPEICATCGLPKDLCTCGVIEREVQKIRVALEQRRFGKQATIIEGVTENAKQLASQLKSKLACGGTVKEGRIELQGDHRNRLKDLLVKAGYEEGQIEIM
jgi:translation initiation factor 1